MDLVQHGVEVLKIETDERPDLDSPVPFYVVDGGAPLLADWDIRIHGEHIVRRNLVSPVVHDFLIQT